MVNVTEAPIIVAVLGLVGAIAAAALATYVTYRSESYKRRSDLTIIVNKYQDPLLLSAVALHARLNTIKTHVKGIPVSPSFPDIRPPPPKNIKDDYLLIHTAFLVGQYFAWVHILRIESQFLGMQRAHKTKSLTDAFFKIERAWSRDWDNDEKRNRFMLWRGQQTAIGELMTVTHDEKHSCIGYAEFRNRWYSESGLEFTQWFGDFANNHDNFWSERLDMVLEGLRVLIFILDPEKLFQKAYNDSSDPEIGNATHDRNSQQRARDPNTSSQAHIGQVFTPSRRNWYFGSLISRAISSRTSSARWQSVNVEDPSLMAKGYKLQGMSSASGVGPVRERLAHLGHQPIQPNVGLFSDTMTMTPGIPE